MHLVLKEFLELRQDPKLFGIVILAPILQLTVLGYAATTDVLDVPVVVVDQDGSTASRQLITKFETSPSFALVDIVPSIDDIDTCLDSGGAWLAVTIPAGYGERVGSSRPGVIQFVADGTDANSTNIALGYARALVAAYASELAAEGSGRIAVPLIGADVRVWFNPSLESQDFMIPGILALVLLVVTTNLSSMAIVREKELGTLEQLNVTPLARWQLIVGKLVP
jgi:ABC-2 type transport system permease protein